MSATRVQIFKNAESDPKPSMRIYAEELIQSLKKYSSFEINEVSIKGTQLPFLKDAISKDCFYPLYARLREGDINHIIDHSYGAVAYGLNPRHTVVTCHDLIPLELKSQSSWLGRKRFLYNVRGMLRARNIIAVSESTKQSILKHFRYEGRIWVIPQGINENFKKIKNPKRIEEVKRDLRMNERYRYLLHVGLSTPTKNVELILRSLANLPQCQLIKVGRFTPRQIQMIKELNIEERVSVLALVPQEKLTEIYNVVDLLIAPSLFEGFGLPVVEAMACGCPVICSKTSSLPEVAGDAAVYIDPLSEKSLREAIDKVLMDGSLREKLMEKGLERAKQFSWEKTAAEVLKVYKEILSHG